MLGDEHPDGLTRCSTVQQKTKPGSSEIQQFQQSWQSQQLQQQQNWLRTSRVDCAGER